MAGNSPELKQQKNENRKKVIVCYKIESITQEKSGKGEAYEVQWAFFSEVKVCNFKEDFSCVLFLVEWVWHKQTAASSLEHWKHFLLGYIEIMVLSCQCETHVFFNKGHIYIYIYL